MAGVRITVTAGDEVGAIDRRLFGSFVEHLGRCVYDGIHEPTHPSADADGFRTDVMALVRELGVTTLRYPGGNFVSGYRWEDGVGPRESRPRRLDLAWHSLETNQVGLHEFAGWASRVGADLMLALNLGTRGTLAALDLVEYANHAGGTALSDLRVRNGSPEPFGVRMWCLGNEMDGPWQLGHRSADDYGKLAARTAMALRQYDPGLQLVACGSSGRGMPTFGSWERQVLRHAYADVDLISCHAYYQERDGDAASFLASAADMDAFIEEVAATADAVKAELGADKVIDISFDEWNVWYLDRFQNEEKLTGDDWPVAPRLLEDQYSVTDAVVVGTLLISLLNHADRVKAASLAQLVNVIAPIMTEPGGPAWRQTTFFPFALTARLATGTALRPVVVAPRQETAVHGEVPVVVASATSDAGGVSLFVANRSLVDPAQAVVELSGFETLAVAEAWTLADPDRHARNSLEEPDRVRPWANASARVEDGRLSLDLPPVSWTAVRLVPADR